MFPAIAAALFWGLVWLPVRLPALTWDDFRAPAADQMPFFVEEVELSRAQRDEVVLGLIALARNHCPQPLTTTEGVMALALAEALDPDQPALAQSWQELRAGRTQPIHAGRDLELLLARATDLADGLATAKTSAHSQRFAHFLHDLVARCRARLRDPDELPAPPSADADWTAFFPSWPPGEAPPETEIGSTRPRRPLNLDRLAPVASESTDSTDDADAEQDNHANPTRPDADHAASPSPPDPS